MDEDNTGKKRPHQSISVINEMLHGEKDNDNVKIEGTEENEDASHVAYNENPDTTTSHHEGSDSDVNSKSKRDERRLEMNRQRAKDIRRRKKKMMEEMQKQIVFLTMENNKLRTQNQMQQAEINLLRTSQQEQVSCNYLLCERYSNEFEAH